MTLNLISSRRWPWTPYSSASTFQVLKLRHVPLLMFTEAEGWRLGFEHAIQALYKLKHIPSNKIFFQRKKKQCDLVLLTMYWGKFQLGLKTPVIKNENKLKEAYGISAERKSLLNTENIEVVIRGKDGYLYKYNSENKIWQSLFK